MTIRFRAGNMASPSPVLKPLVKRLLAPWSGDPTNAIHLAVANGRVVSPSPDLLQSRACRFMEEEVARQIGAHRSRSSIASAVRTGKAVGFRCFDPNVALTPGVYLFPASKDDVAAKTIAAFRAMYGRVPTYGKTAALHEMDVQILTQVKNVPVGSKELNRAIEVKYWGSSPTSRIGA